MKTFAPDATGSRSGKFRLAQLLCCLGLVFAVYSNCLQNGFYLDDYNYIVQNANIQDLHGIARMFRSAAANSTQEEQAVYRPLFPATFAVDYWWAGGMNPAGMHLSQLLYFLLLNLGILQLLRGLLALAMGASDRTEWIALFAALLYGLHPANSELVNYLSARSELLSAIGAVWALVIYLFQPRLRPWGLWILPMLIGALAKPVALVLPALWLAGAVLLKGWVCVQKTGVNMRIASGALFAFALAVVAFISLRHFDGPMLHYGREDALVYLRQQCWSWLFYAGLFLWPANLSADYPQTFFSSWLDWHCVAGLSFSAGLVVCGVFYALRRPRCGRLALLGILWYFIALAPSSSIIPLSELIREYRLSFPAIGLMITLAAVTADVVENASSLRRVVLAAGLAIAAAAGVATHLRNRVWRDEISIFADVVRKHPDDLRARLSLGRLYLMNGQNDMGRQMLLEVEKISVPTPWSCILLGNLYLSEHDLPKAERYYKMALSIPPVNSQAHYAYAHFLDSVGRTPEAIAELEAGLAAAPSSFNARETVMALYLKIGDYPNYCRHGEILMKVQGWNEEFHSKYCQPGASAPR